MPEWLAGLLQSMLYFRGTLNESIAAIWMIAAVLLLRLLLKRAPKWTHVALWGIVALRLLLPVSLESPLSLIPSVEPIPDVYDMSDRSIPAELELVDNPAFSQRVAIPLNTSREQVSIRLLLFTVTWWSGAVLLLLYALLGTLHLKFRLRTAVRLQNSIWQSEFVSSPFVFGLFHPRIYLPNDLSEPESGYVIAHEQAHICRLDHWWKLLGFLLLAVHWFNPVMWLAYVLFCRDLELACDERVISALEPDCRADYAQALLCCSVPRGKFAVFGLAFGELRVRTRVKNVLKFRKPAIWLLRGAVIACVFLAVCFLTDPQPVPDVTGISGLSLREQLRLGDALDTDAVECFDVQTFGGYLFAGCRYDGKYGLAFFKPKGDGTWRLDHAKKQEKLTPRGEDIYFEFYTAVGVDVQVFLVANPDVTAMEWSGDHTEWIEIDRNPAVLVVDYLHALSGNSAESSYRFHGIE